MKENKISFILFLVSKGIDIASINKRKYAAPATHALTISRRESPKIIMLFTKTVSLKRERIQ